jgi:DNA-binding MarR family transcriptional regulator
VPRRADVSLLFDFFVVSQRLRRVLADALAPAGMRPDEYAVYSLLYEKGPLTATEMAEFMAMPLTTVLDYLRAMTAAGHVVRTSHPFDGRATQLSLSRRGIAAQERAHASWEVIRKQIEEGLALPVPRVRQALRALDDSVLQSRLDLRLQSAAAEKRVDRL